MAKITGLDKLSKKLKELSQFTDETDGHLGSITYDPNDPGSIDRAISQIATLVDERASHYPSNDHIQNIAESMKESYTNQLLAKAAEKRAEGRA